MTFSYTELHRVPIAIGVTEEHRVKKIESLWISVDSQCFSV